MIIKILKKMASREWRFTTILVFIGVVLCIRLGIWQLDRLEQRRLFNAHVEKMWAAERVKLPDDLVENKISLKEMEYRSITVSGDYDFASEVALRNQYWEDRFGYHLLTPMVIGDGIAVLIDRGWIPAEENENPMNWEKYNSDQTEEITGIIRLGQDRPDIGGRPDPTMAPGQKRLDIWNNVNLERISDQVPYELLDVYVQLDEGSGDREYSLPIPFQPEIELSEGPHLGYAGQWFTFASILFFGYPVFISKRENLR